MIYFLVMFTLAFVVSSPTRPAKPSAIVSRSIALGGLIGSSRTRRRTVAELSEMETKSVLDIAG